MKLVRSSIFIVSGFPCEKVRSAPAIVVSGPAQRSLPLWPARSRSRLATLSIESSDSLVASAAVSIATGWNEPVPGRELHPLKSSAFHGALFRQLRTRYFSVGPPNLQIAHYASWSECFPDWIEVTHLHHAAFAAYKRGIQNRFELLMPLPIFG